MSHGQAAERPAQSVGIRVLAEDLWFPEGPVMLPDGRVAVVEVGAGTIVALGPNPGDKDLIATPGGGPNGLAWGPDGALYLCNNGGSKWVRHGNRLEPHGVADDYETGRIERIDPITGEVTRLYDSIDGTNRLNAPNDIVFAPPGSSSEGGFWFTDYGKGHGRTRDFGGVYWAAVDGSSIIEAAFPIAGGPNGIGLSPDGSRLYVAETLTARLWTWEVEGPGVLAKDPWPDPHGGTLLSQVPGRREFDSLAVTAAGNIVVGTLFAPGLTTIDPSGVIVGTVEFDDPMPTNVCFGGPDRRTAYVTLSLTGRVVEVAWDEPGLDLPYSHSAAGAGAAAPSKSASN
jgi:gluconolactonase